MFAWDDEIYASDPELDQQLNEKIIVISEKHLSDHRWMINTNRFYRIAKSKALNNLGLIYQNKGNYTLAIGKYSESLKLSEENGDMKLTASALGNIANIYLDQGELDDALNYYGKNLIIVRQLNDKRNEATTLSNIGVVYQEKKEYHKAMAFYKSSWRIRELIGDEYGVAISLGNIGNLLLDEKKYNEAYPFFQNSKAIREKINDTEGLTGVKINFGIIHHGNNQLDSALMDGREAMAMAKKLENTELLKDASMLLKNVYFKKRDFLHAFEQLELYYFYRDKMIGEENKKEISRQQYKYEYEKKSSAEKIMHEEEQKLNQAQLKYEQQQRYVLYAGLFLLLVFGWAMYNRFKITSRQKKIIELQKGQVEEQKKFAELQKEIVEEKQKEILDSIIYAKRLQQAILVTPEEFNKYLPDSFLMYKPKDIVAGDFYFFEDKDDLLFVAAADCTGHGVPGALVSVVCSNALSRSVNEFGLTDPGKILDKTRELVVTTFEKSGSDIKDGMDISLAVIRKDKSELLWAGANNPLWYTKGKEMMECKPDKQPIGKSEEDGSFTTHRLLIENEMTVYLFTDGYPDQFGGNPTSRSGGKKFKYSRFKELLISIFSLPVANQKEEVEKTFYRWKGDFEQTDDICVLAIKFNL